MSQSFIIKVYVLIQVIYNEIYVVFISLNQNEKPDCHWIYDCVLNVKLLHKQSDVQKV